jgi:molybdate transport system substrate-binding protein
MSTVVHDAESQEESRGENMSGALSKSLSSPHSLKWICMAVVFFGAIAVAALGVSISALMGREKYNVILREKQEVVRIVKSGGFSLAFDALEAAFKQSYPWIELYHENGSSLGNATTSIPSRLERGEQWDVVIMFDEGFDILVESGQAHNNSDMILGTSPIAMCVQPDKPIPDISTESALRNVLLNDCDTVAISDSASGQFILSDVYPSLGIFEEMENKTYTISSDEAPRVGTLVVANDPRADCAFQQATELTETGCKSAGNIPASVQKYSNFVGGVPMSVENIDAANLVLYFFSSPANSKLIAFTGMLAGDPKTWSRESYSGFFNEGIN